jgi:F-type H+-transporting ATPase subunit b
MELDAEFWVAVAFVLLLGLFIYLGVPKTALNALDKRAARIKDELDEARRLRDEAQAVLADSERRRRDAEKEASEIVTNARAEAERVAADARTKAEEFVARRTKMAETKIAQAESQAVADVRSAAADAAVAAAEIVLTGVAKGKVAEDLIAQGIRDVKAKLN